VAGNWKPQRTKRLLKSDGSVKASLILITIKQSLFKIKKEIPIKLIFDNSVALKD